MAIAFSPGIYDLVRQWLHAPWSRYSALFVVLTVWLIASGTAGPTAGPVPRLRRGIGGAAIAAGLLLQLAAGLAVMPSLARPAMLLGGLGLLWLRGLAPLSVACVAVWIVPLPHQVMDGLGGDTVAAGFLRAASEVVNLFGAGVAAGARRVISGDAALVVDSSQSGLPTLVAMLGVGAYAALRLQIDIVRALRCLPALVAAAIAGQFVASVLACLALAAGSLALAGFCIDSLSWMLPAAVVVWGVEGRVEQRMRNPDAST